MYLGTFYENIFLRRITRPLRKLQRIKHPLRKLKNKAVPSDSSGPHWGLMNGPLFLLYPLLCFFLKCEKLIQSHCTLLSMVLFCHNIMVDSTAKMLISIKYFTTFNHVCGRGVESTPMGFYTLR